MKDYGRRYGPEYGTGNGVFVFRSKFQIGFRVTRGLRKRVQRSGRTRTESLHTRAGVRTTCIVHRCIKTH